MVRLIHLTQQTKTTCNYGKIIKAAHLRGNNFIIQSSENCNFEENLLINFDNTCRAYKRTGNQLKITTKGELNLYSK